MAIIILTGRQRKGSAGKIEKNVEIQILDPNTRKTLPFYERGKIFFCPASFEMAPNKHIKEAEEKPSPCENKQQ
jgi:hypothetical protein